jgi:hypothetical protein
MKIYFGDIIPETGTIGVDFGDGYVHTYNRADLLGKCIPLEGRPGVNYSNIRVIGKSTILSNLDVIKKIKAIEDPYVIFDFRAKIGFLVISYDFIREMLNKGSIYLDNIEVSIRTTTNFEDGNLYTDNSKFLLSPNRQYYTISYNSELLKDCLFDRDVGIRYISVSLIYNNTFYYTSNYTPYTYMTYND